jgi:hypothetical protein
MTAVVRLSRRVLPLYLSHITVAKPFTVSDVVADAYPRKRLIRSLPKCSR